MCDVFEICVNFAHDDGRHPWVSVAYTNTEVGSCLFCIVASQTLSKYWLIKIERIEDAYKSMPSPDKASGMSSLSLVNDIRRTED